MENYVTGKKYETSKNVQQVNIFNKLNMQQVKNMQQVNFCNK